jgi:hypothetical protein
MRPMKLAGVTTRDSTPFSGSQGRQRGNVTPGDPDESYPFAKLTGTQSKVGGRGDSMPAGQGRLPPNEIELIRAWIQDGARP